MLKANSQEPKAYAASSVKEGYRHQLRFFKASLVNVRSVGASSVDEG